VKLSQYVIIVRARGRGIIEKISLPLEVRKKHWKRRGERNVASRIQVQLQEDGGNSNRQLDGKLVCDLVFLWERKWETGG